MKFTKEQQDFLKHCGEHFEILTGGRGHSKTKEVIEDMQQEIERLNNIIDELEKTLKEEVKGLYNEENPMLLDETYIKYATERKMAYMYILDKLNELKGDNK